MEMLRGGPNVQQPQQQVLDYSSQGVSPQVTSPGDDETSDFFNNRYPKRRRGYP
jgi:hypothetical protein